MKKLVLIVAVCVSTLSFGQSNEKGTIHANAGLGFGLDAGSVSTAGGPSSDLLGFQFNYGLGAEYGLAKFISAGLYIKGIGSGTTITPEGEDVDVDNNPSLGMKGLGLGISASLYAVNHDRFNVYVKPSFGYALLSSDLYDDDGDVINDDAYFTKGMMFGLNAGVNVYFGDKVGMFFDLGYTGYDLTLTDDDTPLSKDQDIVLGNIGVALGVAFKFGK